MIAGRNSLSIVAIALIISCNAFAEKADRNQVTDISSKQASVEGSKEANLKKLEGDVLITQGTMRITAERAIVKETTQGVFAELFGSAAKQITFRQKREGESDYVEASADRAEYDDKTETIRLFSRVHFKSGGDLVDSEFMQYNTNTEKMELRNQIPGEKAKAGAEEGRVTFKILPRAQPQSVPGAGKPPAAKTN